ncbi:hypothetical protein K2173_012604 [Erythroxylum novogranatense]|uniref:Uncharacterized protein n=1 Tax=Erythroxylum novogranatense TaxID=1862640 RepID=A0AAV8S7G7_9ROSI|nr:hypothetical protein K2173_012604 [Erythroxylum novogranatense]
MGGCASKPKEFSDNSRPEPLVDDTPAKSPDNQEQTNPVQEVNNNNGDEKEGKISEGGESVKEEAPLADVSEPKPEEGSDVIPSSETKAESISSAVIAQLVDNKVEADNVTTTTQPEIVAVDAKEPESAKLPAKVEDKADAPNVTV